MDKLEQSLFGALTSKSGFYIKDYDSDFLGKNKWIAVLDSEEFIYAVVTCKDSESDFIYSEAKEFLFKNYSKKISLNMVICTNNDYSVLKDKNYNKLIYSINNEQVVYSDESCEPLVSILKYSNIKKKSNKEKLKENYVTFTLIAINILIFILTAVISKNIYDIDTYTLVLFGAKVNELILNGQPWRLLTSAFLHGGLMHLVFNMYALKIIGSEVEYVYGKAKYLIIYLFSALGGSVFSYVFNVRGISVGASGAIFGLFGAMLIFGIKNRAKINKAYIMSLVKVILINIFIGATISNIDNSAHIGGLVFGAIAAFAIGNKKIY